MIEEPAWSEMVRGIRTALLMTAQTMKQTKPELVAGLRKLMANKTGQEGFTWMEVHLHRTCGQLKVMSELVEAAHIRQLCAAAVVAQGEDEPAA
jgi:hypothetical protein